MIISYSVVENRFPMAHGKHGDYEKMHREEIEWCGSQPAG